MSTKTIVLAEDDTAQRCLYTEYLSAHGFNVMAAASGQEALDLLNRWVQPKLVLLDIMMPELNGIETCRQARAIIGYKIPIVFLTALDFADQLEEGLKAGGDDYLLKTFSLDLLLKRVIYWTSPFARDNSEWRQKKALKKMFTAEKT